MRENVEKIDFVAVRKCVSGDSAWFRGFSVNRLLRLEMFCGDEVAAETHGKLREKIAIRSRFEMSSGPSLL
jgi:hypothetical protein